MSRVFEDAISNFLLPIRNLLEDEAVTEIMINGPYEIFVEKRGAISKVANAFTDEGALMAAVTAVAQSVGRVVNDEKPRLDARLPNGQRIHVVLPPIARGGTTVSIRKFSKEKLTLKDLINFESISVDAARFLDVCVYLGKNIMVSGGTGSGKTTLLNVLGGRIPRAQRILVMEDASELQIIADHVVRFETREANKEFNVTPISMRDLVKSAMRLRPDRIIVGEVRGEEALDLLQVMNTGHEGSMGTIHANTPLDACFRIETLCMLAGSEMPHDLVRRLIANVIHVIVQVARLHDGSRRVSHITEIVGLDSQGRYICKDIFRWFQKDKDEKTGKYIGETVPCGYIPTFFDDIVLNKLPFPKEKFVPPDWAKALLKDQK
jgi:pilus assembly protein CpaF